MPKEKEKALKKKKAGCSNNTEDNFKRRNSLTDASSTSSSSASSDISTASSLDSDESTNTQNDKEKSTMTKNEKKGNDHEEGSSSNTCKSLGDELVSKILELNIDPTGNAAKKPVKLVENVSEIPITDKTHFKLLVTEDSKKKSSVPPVNGAQVQNNGNSGKKKKNQKERKLTKKEKKEQASNVGQLNQGETVDAKQPNEKLLKKQVASFLKREDPGIHISSFDDWGTSEPTGKMVVTGVNDAAREALGGPTVDMPFYGRPELLENSLGFIDGHQICQTKFLAENTLRSYTNFSHEEKLTQRMGFGISGSGLKDNIPKTLSLNKANHLLKMTFSEHIEKSYNLENWRNSFSANLMNESHNQDGRYKELVNHMKAHVEKMVNEQEDPWKKELMNLALNGEVKKVLNHFGELDRIIRLKDSSMRKSGIKINVCRYQEVPFKERISICVKILMEWLMHEYLENAPEHVNVNMNGKTVHVMRGVSAIMYLAATHENEKPCFQNGHKKCTMLSFLLGSMDQNLRRKLLNHSFTNSLTPLHFAAMTGWPCQIDVLLKYGSSTEITSDNGKTPLWFTAKRNSTLMARQLMWHGADLSAVTSNYSGVNEYDTSVISINGYLSRKFLNERRRALQDIYIAWLSSYLSECDQNVLLKVKEFRSDLHECRIGASVADKHILPEPTTAPCECFLKIVPINLPNAITSGPVVLFLVPVSYTKFDTTMKAHLPHIVRVPMLENSRKVIDELEKKIESMQPLSEAEKERIYSQTINKMKPCNLLAESPVMVIGDGEHDHEIKLQPFFDNMTNGLIYGYLVPDILSRIQSRSRVALKLLLSSKEIEQFHNCFFMIQVVELACERIEQKGEGNEIDIQILTKPTTQKTKKD